MNCRYVFEEKKIKFCTSNIKMQNHFTEVTLVDAEIDDEVNDDVVVDDVADDVDVDCVDEKTEVIVCVRPKFEEKFHEKCF